MKDQSLNSWKELGIRLLGFGLHQHIVALKIYQSSEDRPA